MDDVAMKAMDDVAREVRLWCNRDFGCEGCNCHDWLLGSCILPCKVHEPCEYDNELNKTIERLNKTRSGIRNKIRQLNDA